MPVIERYTVLQQGIGRPDYSPHVSVGKPVLSPHQTPWSHLWTTQDDLGGRLPPGTLTVTAYTVPMGYELHLGGGIVSCESSCIQLIALVATPGILGDFRYDMRGDIIFSPDTASLITEGQVLQYIISNLDVAPRHFSLSLAGTLEEVS